jgi:hypothetical protein
MKTLLLFCFIIIGFIGISAQERYVKPVDEAAKDASFLAFRTKLISAVKRHDAKYLVSILDRDISASFGGDKGIEDFKKMWKLNSPNSELWGELLTVLTNGGTFSTEENTTIFSAPYLFNEFPGDLDAFEYQAIFGNNVNLRSRADLKSEVIARLSYNIVKVDYQNSVSDKRKDGEYLWYKVETLGGLKGFVKAEFVRSPIDYRAGFQKKAGKWKMVYFIAGD